MNSFLRIHLFSKVRYTDVSFKEVKMQNKTSVPPVLQVPSGYWYNSRGITIAMDVM